MEATVTTESQLTKTVRITLDSLMAVSVFIRYFMTMADFVSKSLEEAKAREGLTAEQRQSIEDMYLRLEALSEVAKELLGVFELAAKLANESVGGDVVISLFGSNAQPDGTESVKSKYVH